MGIDFEGLVPSWRKRLLLLFIVVVVGVGLDQLSKIGVQTSLARALLPTASSRDTALLESRAGPIYVPIRRIVLISGLFDIRYVENSAAAFSLTRSIPLWFRMPLLIAVSTVAIIFFLWWYLTLQEASRFLLFSFCMVMAGALGNLLDRARLGYVIDFLHFHAGFAGHPELYWPTFNVADSLIVVGACGIILHAFFERRRPVSSQLSSCCKQQQESSSQA